MHSLSLALAFVFSAQVLAASMRPRGLGPPDWEFLFCLEDNRDIGFPLLTGAGFADPAGMTIEKCADFCDSQPVSYRFMGLTDGFQCSCDNFFEHIFESVPDGACNVPCPGNPSELGGCGGKELGQQMASAYQKVNSTFIIPALVPSVGLWNGLGCYKSVRVNAGNTTVETCVSACQAQGFSLAGVEFGRECCAPILRVRVPVVCTDDGQGVVHNFSTVQGSLQTTMGLILVIPLTGKTQTYRFVTWAAKATRQNDLVSSRTLQRRVNAGNVTVESCVSACQSQSFTIAGLEFAQECWCGNAIGSPGVPISQSACNQACIGDNTEVCGGPNALQVYS
ncbi:WSC domain-containing protein [Lactarius indigo]|nr:WSC domain-containing protein [Lactarius indigo]